MSHCDGVDFARDYSTVATMGHEAGAGCPAPKFQLQGLICEVVPKDLGVWSDSSSPAFARKTQRLGMLRQPKVLSVIPSI